MKCRKFQIKIKIRLKLNNGLRGMREISENKRKIDGPCQTTPRAKSFSRPSPQQRRSYSDPKHARTPTCKAIDGESFGSIGGLAYARRLRRNQGTHRTRHSGQDQHRTKFRTGTTPDPRVSRTLLHLQQQAGSGSSRRRGSNC